MLKLPDAEEVERRLRRVSQMRNFFVTMRREAQAAYARGEWKYKPLNDIRSDVDYWKEQVRKAQK